jgi:hypothetical protein
MCNHNIVSFGVKAGKSLSAQVRSYLAVAYGGGGKTGNRDLDFRLLTCNFRARCFANRQRVAGSAICCDI